LKGTKWNPNFFT